MGKELMAAAPMLPGLADEKDISDLIATFQIEQAQFNGPIYLNRMPSTVERHMLQKRNLELIEGLKPYGIGSSKPPCDVRRAMAGMYRGYTMLRQDEAMDLLDASMLVLHRFPRFAILAAIDDVLANRVPGLSEKYPPNSAQLGRIAANHTARVGAQQAKIDKILRARGPMRVAENDAASRGRIEAGFKDLTGRLRVGGIAGTLTDDDRQRISARQKLEARQTVLEEWKRLGMSPILNKDGSPMSVALAKQLGRLVEFRRPDGVSYSVPREEVDRG